MTKFVLLYFGGGMPETETETAEVIKAWEAWYTALGSAVVDPGHPLAPVASIASDKTVSDGPTGAMATGYTIIQAESIDEAVTMAQSCPVLMGGADISVFEAFEVMKVFGTRNTVSDSALRRGMFKNGKPSACHFLFVLASCSSVQIAGNGMANIALWNFATNLFKRLDEKQRQLLRILA